jgi:hypothetical protein
MRKGKDPNLNLDPYLYKMDPDLGIPKTCGSCRSRSGSGSGSPTLVFKILAVFCEENTKEDRYESEGKPEQTFDAAFGTICRINECFKEASIKFILCE